MQAKEKVPAHSKILRPPKSGGQMGFKKHCSTTVQSEADLGENNN